MITIPARWHTHPVYLEDDPVLCMGESGGRSPRDTFLAVYAYCNGMWGWYRREDYTPARRVDRWFPIPYYRYEHATLQFALRRNPRGIGGLIPMMEWNEDEGTISVWAVDIDPSRPSSRKRVLVFNTIEEAVKDIGEWFPEAK